MMAGSEARAAWTRTANRFIVQEDAKRAPKLTCYQTSLASSNHVESGPTCSPNGLAHFVAAFTSPSGISLRCNLLPDSRWWLQLQPIFAYQNRLIPSSQDTKFVDTTFYLKKEVQIPDELCFFDSDSVLFSNPKAEPWWHKTDREELISIISQKSIDNYDLQHPAKMRVPDSFSCSESLKNDEFLSSLGRIPQSGISVSNSNISKSPLSHPRMNVLRERHIVSESDFERAQLVEALCHSQTRARKAENKAKKVKYEKEHLVKLLFRQASQIFAYKQILNLPLMAPKQQKIWENYADWKHVKWISAKFMVALALWFGLVGSGLILGWTVGWILSMLPSF